MKIKTILSKNFGSISTDEMVHGKEKTVGIQVVEVNPLQRVVKFKCPVKLLDKAKRDTVGFELPKAAELSFPYLQIGILKKEKIRKKYNDDGVEIGLETRPQTDVYITGSDEPFDGDFAKLSVVPSPNSTASGWICLGDNYNPKTILHIANDFFSKDFTFFEITSFGHSFTFLAKWLADKKMPKIEIDFKDHNFVKDRILEYYLLWAEAFNYTLTIK